jgi:hydroxyacylglutathione hydrolase
MSLTVHQFPCLSDNYGFLVRDDATGKTATIDTPDADAILAQLDTLGWTLDFILNTHWHPDHAGGNAAIKAATGAIIVGPRKSPESRRWIARSSRATSSMLGETRFKVIDTGGHTLGHIAYHDAQDEIAFVGDTLFALGCGRLFEGTAEQMWGSLAKLTALPDATTVYCAHEYTASNARFALSVDDDPALKARAEQVFAARERGEPTVPTSIGVEKATNPFLRAPLLRPNLEPADGVRGNPRRQGRLQGMSLLRNISGDLGAKEIIRLLDMQPHPEGGWYRRTFEDVAVDGARPCRRRSTTCWRPSRCRPGTGSTPSRSGTTTPARRSR